MRKTRLAVPLAAAALVTSLTGGPAAADVYAGEGYASTTVRCESGRVELVGMMQPYYAYQPVYVFKRLWIYQGAGQWTNIDDDRWTQISNSWQATQFVDPDRYYYVHMYYAFWTGTEWLVRDEPIEQYQSGGFNGLEYCRA